MRSATRALVGREAELAVLERTLRAVEGGAARAVGVVGEPGIGKSRLLAELGHRAYERGHLVLAARAAELERDVPFALWVEALDGHVARSDGELLKRLGEEQLADLAVALPAVAQASGVAPAGTGERHRVARAVRGLLEGIAAGRAVCVLLDDVQWADPASVDVIALLLHRLPEGAALLALSARSGQAIAVEQAVLSAVRHDAADLLEIGALPREAADALLPTALGPAARAQAYRESGGNPFYLLALAGASGSHGGEVSPGGRDAPRSREPRAPAPAACRGW